jgi:hypothetical protein
MNQTKKRLSIIELAISITDIETIKLQMIQLTPLRTDNRIDEILSFLESGNYAHAQNLILLYIEEVHDTVIQRIPETEETPVSKNQAIIDEYDFLSESTTELDDDVESNTEEESIDSISREDQEIVYIEQNEGDIDDSESNSREALEVKTHSTDYTTLLDINPDEILVQNVQLDFSDKTQEIIKKEKNNFDFDLNTIPKDGFFENELEISATPKTIEIPHIDESQSENFIAIQKQTNDETEIKTIITTKDTFYPAITNIYAIFQDIQLTYPAVHQANGYSDMLEVWLEKIVDEGYSEAEVEKMLKHIEQLTLENKAEAAQFLQVTSSTESKYAKFILARSLYKGTLLKRNLDESFRMMSHLAFDEKYPEALCDLAQFYENGIGTEKDKMQAELLYRDAINSGIQRAIKHYTRIQKENKGFFSFLKH